MSLSIIPVMSCEEHIIANVSFDSSSVPAQFTQVSFPRPAPKIAAVGPSISGMRERREWQSRVSSRGGKRRRHAKRLIISFWSLIGDDDNSPLLDLILLDRIKDRFLVVEHHSLSLKL